MPQILVNLTYEELSLAFRVIAGLEENPKLPPILEGLETQEWNLLAGTLGLLLNERDRSTVH
jgi:hypothetical protein